MKWRKGPIEFLPEKTFLIIKDDLDSLTAAVEPSRRKKAKSVPDTGTWPPKLKKYLVYGAAERPKTANLDKPSILDPNLVNKLDMSLLSKELLCDSMTRIQHDMQKLGGGTSSRCRRRVKSSGKHGSISSIVDIKTFGTRQKRRSYEHVILEQLSSAKQTQLDSVNMKKQLSVTSQINLDDNVSKKRMSLDIKRLDDNNNRNGSGTIGKIIPTSLSSVKTIKSARPAEIEVFTAVTTKTAPEPCKTCGRPDQPERLHSHPKGIIIPTKNSSKDLSNGKSKDIVKKTVQKPVALNFRSEKRISKDKKDETGDSNKKKKAGSPSSPNEVVRKPMSSAGMKKGPRTVTCYICAREFGTASFPIHEPKCMQRWERENNALPSSQRRPVPQRPNVPLDHQEWNKAAWELSQTQLVPCWKCGRTFLPDRLTVHQKSCKASPKRTESATEKSERPETTNNRSSALSTICCQVCGRNFSSRSIKIHEPQCMKRWQVENDALPPNQRKKEPPKWEKTPLSPTQSSSAPISPSTDVPYKKMTTCYICGREFGSASIEIHEPQCLKKWNLENSKLPVSQQRQEPQKPEVVLTRASTSSNPVIDVSATSEARWKSHLGQLIPCTKCKRTFNPDRVSVHERTCKGSR